ncbi:MAG TPA: HlyD family efflux transporter periplasmic adaptor subunit [Haliangiales bacterium]|nr:HlyD family efflux transporter periplasmic adaptor subunit [Haliangiales bacterium]
MSVGAGRIVELSHIGDLPQALEQRPPAMVHGAFGLSAALVAAVLTWAALAPADLVVRGAARVRSIDGAYDAFDAAAAGERVAAEIGGRVKTLLVREGAQVNAGDPLFALDTERLDLDLERARRVVAAGREELAGLDRMAKLLDEQHAADLAKIDAELAQVTAEERRGVAERASDVRLAELELAHARADEARLRAMQEGGAAAPAEVDRVTARVRDAEARLTRTRLPARGGRAAVLGKQRDQLDQDHAFKVAQLDNDRLRRRSDLEAATSGLAARELERKQSVVRAPVDGVVALGSVRVGDYVEAGRPVAAVAPDRGYRVDVAVGAADIGRVRIGMRAHVRLDAYDDQTYGDLEGTIQYIAPDSKLAGDGRGYPYYLVSVTLSGQGVGRGEQRARLRLGLVGQGEIVVGTSSVLALWFRHVREGIRLD